MLLLECTSNSPRTSLGDQCPRFCGLVSWITATDDTGRRYYVKGFLLGDFGNHWQNNFSQAHRHLSMLRRDKTQIHNDNKIRLAYFS